MSFVVQLRRMENSQPWGFRLRGGLDQNIPLFVEHVQPNGRGAHSGLQMGDLVVAICGVPTANMAHAEVKSAMLRAGNELDLEVVRGGAAMPPCNVAPAEPKRVELDESPLPKFGGPTYKDVKPKTYQILESQLHEPAEQAEASAPRPSSIFDRKRDDRSQYLKASEATIQKAYGQTH